MTTKTAKDLHGNLLGKAEAVQMEQQGYTYIGMAYGQPSPNDKRSNLYKVCKAAEQQGYTDIIYIISGHRQTSAAGWSMIVMAR